MNDVFDKIRSITDKIEQAEMAIRTAQVMNSIIYGEIFSRSKPAANTYVTEYTAISTFANVTADYIHNAYSLISECMDIIR